MSMKGHFWMHVAFAALNLGFAVTFGHWWNWAAMGLSIGVAMMVAAREFVK